MYTADETTAVRLFLQPIRYARAVIMLGQTIDAAQLANLIASMILLIITLISIAICWYF
ncbi:MAG: hypothetical protein QXM55_01175 [Ignisphaera sp.]